MTVRFDKLEKLAAFLDTLPPEKFDFSVVRDNNGHSGCGSVGCAIGWTPEVFPDEVTAGECCVVRNSKLGRAHLHDHYVDVAVSLFGMPQNEAALLFTALDESDDLPPWLPEKLGEEATAREVAESIRLYCEWKGYGR